MIAQMFNQVKLCERREEEKKEEVCEKLSGLC